MEKEKAVAEKTTAFSFSSTGRRRKHPVPAHVCAQAYFFFLWRCAFRRFLYLCLAIFFLRFLTTLPIAHLSHIEIYFTPEGEY
jgi:hypothetical protein